MGETPDTDRKRLDLSVPQVAGSAVAAVAAAKLASYFGVYGTILGAGLVSVVATCGDKLFQHFFKRTEQQLREATASGRPPKQVPPAPGEFTEGTVHRARVKSWRRPAVAAAVVFGVAMAGITTYEMVSGSSFSGGTGTTVSDAVTRRGSSSKSDSPSEPDENPTPSATPSRLQAPDTEEDSTPATAPTPGDSASEEPDGSPGHKPADGTSPSPSPTPTTQPSSSASAPSTAPEPSAGSGSGTAAPSPAAP